MPEVLEQSDLKIRGKARRDDDAAILLGAALTLADVRDAALWWRRMAPRAYRPMLSGAGFTYDPESMTWTHGDRQLQPEVVKAAVVFEASNAQADARNLALLLIGGSLLLGEWQLQMASLIKRQQIAIAGVARGGLNRLPVDELARTSESVAGEAADVASTGDAVAYQVGRLQRFAEQIEARHESVNTSEKIVRRAELYARSSIPNYEQARGREAIVVGFTEESNVLAEAEHCFSQKDDPIPDCPSQTAAGWQRIGTLTPIGLRKCAMKCLCSMHYRRNVTVIR